MRWLASWLAIALLLQGSIAGVAGVRGSAHRHAPQPSESVPMLKWRHASDARVEARAAHALVHAAGKAHHHTVDDASVLPLRTDAMADASASATFVAAPAPLGQAAWASLDLAHVWSARARWVPSDPALAPPRRPPRC
jgi:hypothetical protein